MTNYFNEVSKRLKPLGNKRDLSKVFNDLLTISICSFHRTNIQSALKAKDEDNEKLYFQTIAPYSKTDLTKLSECLAFLQMNVLDDPYSDILGDFYMAYISHGQNGQYFTPKPVCTILAKINGMDSIYHQRVMDPACGSGRMLLSAAELNHENYFYGSDNNNSCAKMATVNCYLNGLVGEIAWMDCLSMEWSGGWSINQKGIGIVPIDKEQSEIWSEAPKTIKNHDPSKPDQLTLF